MSLQTFFVKLKGGSGSGNFGHSGRKGKRGGSAPGKVWGGEVIEHEGERLSKLEVGQIGETMAMNALSNLYDTPFTTLNVGVNNAPIDVGGDHLAVEVKTGLASNSKSAQRWRATIGQPGKAETELLKSMSKDEKREYNNYKKEKILERKNQMLNELKSEIGEKVNPMTIGVILHPDGSKGDVYAIPGFHLELRWNKYATDEYYLGTYDNE